MSETTPDEWEEAVETLRHDLGVVAEGADDETVSAAIEEVWTIVDAFEERVGDVDVDAVGDVLGVDPEETCESLDVASIPNALVADDPDRAASLSRLTSLVALDGATDHDVGRLWTDDVDGYEADDGASNGGDPDDGPTNRSASGSTAAEGSSGGEADGSEVIRSTLGDAISDLRDRIRDARDRASEPADAGSGTARDDGTDRKGRRSRSPSNRRSSTAGQRSSGRSATTFSTLPSNRRDVGGVSRLSTLPGRRGRSRSSTRSGQSAVGDDSGEDAAGDDAIGEDGGGGVNGAGDDGRRDDGDDREGDGDEATADDRSGPAG